MDRAGASLLPLLRHRSAARACRRPRVDAPDRPHGNQGFHSRRFLRLVSVTHLTFNIQHSTFKTGWTARERRILAGLRTPEHIQRFLDELAYDEKGGAASPRKVMRTGKAQCYSRALFACAALPEPGYAPALMWIAAATDERALLSAV